MKGQGEGFMYIIRDYRWLFVGRLLVFGRILMQDTKNENERATAFDLNKEEKSTLTCGFREHLKFMCMIKPYMCKTACAKKGECQNGGIT